LAVLPVVVWGVLVVRAEPGAWEVWREQVVGRVDGSMHPRPWWYLLPVAAGGLLPATVLAGLGWRRVLAGWRASAVVRGCGWALVVPLVVYSLQSGKLMTYVLPLCPPAAVGVAWVWPRRGFRGFRGWRAKVAVHVVFACWIGLMVAAVVEDRVTLPGTPQLVERVRERTGIDRPQVLTVGFENQALAFYTTRPTERVDPRFTDAEWSALDRESLVLVALPGVWEDWRTGFRGHLLERRYERVMKWPGEGVSENLLRRGVVVYRVRVSEM
jgi:4-amino-4-deoxy-L-arabinose transferase-like glycosyltransferase